MTEAGLELTAHFPRLQNECSTIALPWPVYSLCKWCKENIELYTQNPENMYKELGDK